MKTAQTGEITGKNEGFTVPGAGIEPAQPFPAEGF